MTDFVDTSMLVRYLTGAPPEAVGAASEVIDGVAGLTLTDVVLAETAWVLESYYRVPRAELVDRLMALVMKTNIRTAPVAKDLMVSALLLCQPSRRVSFVDALLWAAARAETAGRVYTFDRRFPAGGIEVRSSPASAE